MTASGNTCLAVFAEVGTALAAGSTVTRSVISGTARVVVARSTRPARTVAGIAGGVAGAALFAPAAVTPVPHRVGHGLPRRAIARRRLPGMAGHWIRRHEGPAACGITRTRARRPAAEPAPAPLHHRPSRLAAQRHGHRGQPAVCRRVAAVGHQHSSIRISATTQQLARTPPPAGPEESIGAEPSAVS